MRVIRGAHQLDGQSAGVEGFFGVLIATRMLFRFLSRPSQTRPTDDTSLPREPCSATENQLHIICKHCGIAYDLGCSTQPRYAAWCGGGAGGLHGSVGRYLAWMNLETLKRPPRSSLPRKLRSFLLTHTHPISALRPLSLHQVLGLTQRQDLHGPAHPGKQRQPGGSGSERGAYR